MLRQPPGGCGVVCGDGGSQGGADDGVPGREVGRACFLHAAVLFVVLDAVAEISQAVGELPPHDGPAVAPLARVVLIDVLVPQAEADHHHLQHHQDRPASQHLSLVTERDHNWPAGFYKLRPRTAGVKGNITLWGLMAVIDIIISIIMETL